MKSKEPSIKYGMKASEFYKNTSYNFLENEKTHCVLEKINLEDEIKSKHKSVEKSTSSESKTERRTISNHMAEDLEITEEHTVQGTFAPKRYVTKCYFQPKQVPVSYSETMIWKIGSTKKRYFESVFTKNVLIPFRWTESMTTLLPGTNEPFNFTTENDHSIKNEFHYISLENQQLKALNGKKEDLEDNINYV